MSDHHEHDDSIMNLSDVRARERRKRKRQRNHHAGARARARSRTSHTRSRAGLLFQVVLSFSLSLTLPEMTRMVVAFSNTRRPRCSTSYKVPLEFATSWRQIPNRLHDASDWQDRSRQGRCSYRSHHRLMMASNNNDNSEEEDQSTTLSDSKNARDGSDDMDPKKQAISALSQPIIGSTDSTSSSPDRNEGSLLPPPLNPPRSSKRQGNKPAKTKMHPSKKFLHAPQSSKKQQQQQQDQRKSTAGSNSKGPTFHSKRNPPKGSKPGRDRYASMLPPPLRDPNDYLNEDEDDRSSPSDQASLSSWEQFLGAKRRPEAESSAFSSSSSPTTTPATSRDGNAVTKAAGRDTDDELSQPLPSMAKLPSIHDLFPPDLSSASKDTDNNDDAGNAVRGRSTNNNASSDRANSSDNTVPLPRHAKTQRQRNRGSATGNNSRSNPSTDSLSTSDPASLSGDKQQRPPSEQKQNNNEPQESQQSQPKQQKQQSSSLEGVLPVSDLFYRSAQQSMDRGGDDEELPFSAEQSDQLAVDHNKVKIRRNQAADLMPGRTNESTAATNSASTGSGSTSKSSIDSGSPRKKDPAGRRRMVRRGMEMLVGGIPINADPPQRNIELWYDTTQPWYASISVNTRDFGPFFHSDSQHLLSRTELGLFCEFFVHYTMKWDVCPKELRSIVQEYHENEPSGDVKNDDATDILSNTSLLQSLSSALSLPEEELEEFKTFMENTERENGLLDTKEPLRTLTFGGVEEFKTFMEAEAAKTRKDQKLKQESAGKAATSRGFGKPLKTKKKQKQKNVANDPSSEALLVAQGGLDFVIGATRAELESGGSAWTDVLKRGIWNSTNKELHHGADLSGEIEVDDVVLNTLVQKEMDDGLTSITLHFTVKCKPRPYSAGEVEKHMLRLNTAMERAVDDGEIQMAFAAAAKEEERWSQELRERIYEDFLFEDYEEDNVMMDEASWRAQMRVGGGSDTGDSAEPDRDEQLMFGASSGVIWDYSRGNVENAPFQGKLGSRLLEAMEERTKENPPKVITVGDVHGCVDELQDLLRQCDYHPGDLVVFLGDLVSKGPDSISVVQMSREIGAIGVRGNHDFEVIRWHQAIKSGVDPPVVGSEHYHVASCLSKADIKWLYSLPWFITSKELSALFVHAGFVSGIRLQKQNPRLMMNMRSILPDGTVTSKFFNNWPWARLWDGPQTVYFGHDADRGLQQYEHAVGLDTGCVYGGRLTACILPEKRLVSVSARREYFKYRRKHYD